MTGWYKHWNDSRSTYYVKPYENRWSIEWYSRGEWQNQTIWSKYEMEEYIRKLIPLTKLEQALK